MHLEDFPAPAPDFGRFRKAILRQAEPERIPFFEIQIDPELMSEILEESVPSPFDTDPEQIRRKLLQDIELMYRLGYDYIIVWNMPVFPGNFIPADDTAPFNRGMRPWQAEDDGPLATRKDLEGFIWPDLTGKKYSRFEFVAQHLPDGMKIIAAIPGVFETVRGLVGITRLCYLIYDDPLLVADIFEHTGKTILQAVGNIAMLDSVGGIVLAEDMGFKSDLMMSPDHFCKFVLPWHKKIGKTIHSQDKIFILHACGKIEKLMDDLIHEAHIDARHSFEDQVTPIEEAKRLYGKHVAVLGGVDMDILARGSENDVRERVRDIASACADGGGFALGTGNSAANYIHPENFLAMLDEGLKIKS